MPAEPAPDTPIARECGPCTACCTVFSISELEKGMFETCSQVCEYGCATYSKRPEPCRTFRCQWLLGVLEVDGSVDPEMRPDASGVIVDFQAYPQGIERYEVWEVEPGASECEPARSIIGELEEHFEVMIVTRSSAGTRGMGTRRFVGPVHGERQVGDRV